VLAAAVLGAGPALAAGAAFAAPGTPSVEFSGGSVLNMLVCRSEPSAGKLTVPAESRITFVNRLGQTGTLRIDGRTVASVGPNQAVPVVFHYGPVNVLMSIACDVGVVEEFRAVTVVVTPKPPVAGAPAGSTGTATGSTAGSARGTTAARSAAPSAAMPPDAGAMPVDPLAPAAGLPAAGAPSAVEGTQAGAAASAADIGDVVAASGEPVHAPSGLLAMIATVLTIGVGVAAMRAAFAGRMARSRFA